MARQRTDIATLLRGIEQAGGIDAYVDAQLREHGFLVQRKPTDNMSQRELARYKKELKDEAAERRKLRKEAREAYETQHIVYLGEGVFWNDAYDYDKWDLEDAEERAAENELPALDKPVQLADALGITVPQLRHLAYHRDCAEMVHYRRFTIPKRNGGERAIWAPLPRLKGVQRWVLRAIVERLLIHGAAHGFVPGRGIHTNARIHRDASIVLKMDIKDFFPSVTFPRVRGVFRKAGYREQIATLLALICTEAPREIVEEDGKRWFVSLGPRCLPQGAPTSPALTNVVCLKLDRRLTGLAEKLGWRYSRYADDMTFSRPRGAKGPPNFATLRSRARQIVMDEGFRVHPDKTHVARRGARQTVTGLVTNGDLPPRVPRRNRRQIRAAIHNLGQGKPLHDGETVDTLAGYIAYIAMTDRAAADRLRQELSAALGG
ncbi:MAG: RNA-directed DNA polymerase [Planctomycetales bacterium]|nr:RNA-directed DNA polymerase [Planctomycetales bacterium]